MVNYYELGGQKKLNQIIVAGSHDAGVTSGKDNVQTQELNILGQASAGVRVFDLRITAAATEYTDDITGKKVVELRAFHAADLVKKDEKKSRLLLDTMEAGTVTRSKLRGGAFGLSLANILRDARAFVTSPQGGNEFLILKFDKCLNWGPIAQRCVELLGDALYVGGGNINNKTLHDLRGKVIVVFSSKGLDEARLKWGSHNGILGFKNLAKGEGTYDPNAWGLQYFGSGGTDIKNVLFDKTKENEKKQTKLMEKARKEHPDVVRMMYWTTTGLVESIRRRNDGMWDPPNIERLKRVWAQGMSKFVDSGVRILGPSALARGLERRKFFPNIVMIDFADDHKCQVIRGLNDLSPQDLAKLE
jgi:hypothetical protein